MEPPPASGPTSQSAPAAGPSIAVLAAAPPASSGSSSSDESERTPERSPKTLLMVAASAAMREDGYVTPPLREYPKEYAKYQIHPMELEKFVAGANGVTGATTAVNAAASTTSPLSNGSAGSKRKRLEFTSSVNTRHDQIAAQQIADMHKGEMGGESQLTAAAAARKRKGSGDFLRKGQWTTTEERLARLLIEAFEEGYLPIYTGIRLRGYLAVQLQCDPMRISKKLCAGVVDGKKIPKNYGQKKFKLRKKQIWDRDEAGRTLAMLEALTCELWKETGITQPNYLSLSSTRSLEDESAPGCDVVRLEDQPPMSINTGNTLKNRTTSKVAKKHKPVVFPIIYLNLSKKLKQHATGSNYVPVQEGDGMESSSSSSTANDVDSASRANAQQPSAVTQPAPPTPPTTATTTTTSMSNTPTAASSSSPQPSPSSSILSDATKSNSNTTDQPFCVDGESLQAAYELLHLYHQESQSQPLRPSVRG